MTLAARSEKADPSLRFGMTIAVVAVATICCGCGDDD
jgi:hypothetical protein